MTPGRPHLRMHRGETNTTTIIIIVLAVLAAGGLLVCGVIGVALFLPAMQAARGAARQAESQNNLRQIGLALHNYHDTYRQFPPSAIVGEDGTEFHSWQSMLLPFVEQAPLHNGIDFHQPWDAPVNNGLFTTVVPTYQNPNVAEQFDARGLALSHYAGNSQVLLPNGSIGLRDITDGSANTMLAGEVGAGYKPWGDPSNVRDPAAGLAVGVGTFSGPPGQNTTVILMADGAVRPVDNNIAPGVLSALATPDAGDMVGAF